MMRIKICKDYEEMSRHAALLVAAQVLLKPNSVVGFATGSTSERLYGFLTEMYNRGELDFSELRSVNLDEYYPISSDNRQSYHYFMQTKLFGRVNIKPENVHIPNGEAADPHEEARHYEEIINSLGGIDFQILGVGRNGHIGFNEPDTSLFTDTHLTSLTQSTIDANSRFFGPDEVVPEHALTMGMGSILKAKKILLIANGASKREAIAKLREGALDTNWPVTLLNMHNDVTVICDEEAAGV